MLEFEYILQLMMHVGMVQSRKPTLAEVGLSVVGGPQVLKETSRTRISIEMFGQNIPVIVRYAEE
jgi:hypothetical protein